MSEQRGLYGKYIITNAETGQAIEGPAFVLKPATDKHAFVALLAYVHSLSQHEENPELRRDLVKLLNRIAKSNAQD